MLIKTGNVPDLIIPVRENFGADCVSRKYMPVYEYRCENCGYDFEQFQHFSEDALSVCPKCGREKLRKVYNSVGIVFKGKGFYANDHKSPSGQSFGHDHSEKSAADSSDSSDKSESAVKTVETKAADAAKTSETTATAAPAKEKK